jgi:uncharacterized protein YkwD
MRRFVATAILGLGAAGAWFVLAPGAHAATCPVGSVLPGCSTPPPTAPPTTAPPTTTPTTPTPPTPPPPSATTTTQPPKAHGQPPADLAAAARRLLELVNAERTPRGLPALARRSDVDAVALAHSQDMAAKGDIWHNNAYFTPATHQALGAVFLGENVAMNSDIDDMHRRLMNSPGHRANILDGRFTQVGIGVAVDSSGYLFATEDFVEPRVPAAKAGPAPAARPASAQVASPPVVPRAAAADVATPGLRLDAGAVVALPGGLVHHRGPAHGDSRWPLPLAAVGLAVTGGLSFKRSRSI